MDFLFVLQLCLSERVKGGSDDEPVEPEPAPVPDLVCFYCCDHVSTGIRLYPGDEDPQLQIAVCCQKPECRAEYCSTEFEEADEIDFTGLKKMFKELKPKPEFTSQYNGVKWHSATQKWYSEIAWKADKDTPTQKVYIRICDDDLEAATAFDTKARELRKEQAGGGRMESGHKHAGKLHKLNFPTPEEQAEYDAAEAALAKNNRCNAGDAAVWGDAAGGFVCDALSSSSIFEHIPFVGGRGSYWIFVCCT